MKKLLSVIRGIRTNKNSQSTVDMFDHRSEPDSVLSSIDAETLVGIFADAEGGNTERMFAFYRDQLVADDHIQSEFTKRKLAVANQPLRVTPHDTDDAQAVAEAEWFQAQLDNCESLDGAVNRLLDSSCYPVSIVEKIYSFDHSSGRYSINKLVPVPYHLIDLRDPTRGLCIYRLDASGRPTSVSDPADPERYIVHRGHMLSVPDIYGGPFRAVAWWWFLRIQARQWWARALDKYGAPFLKGQYESGNDADRYVLERAFSLASRIGGIVTSNTASVEVVQSMMSGNSDAFDRFISQCNQSISRVIVGQTLSATPTGDGLNGGNAALHGEVRDDYRAFDERGICKAIRSGIIAQLHRLNNFQAPIPTLTIGIDEEDADAMAGTLEKLSRAGLQLTDEGVNQASAVFGFPLQKSTPSQPPFFGLSALASDLPKSDDAEALISRQAEDIARGLGIPSAEALRIIRRSKSPDQAAAQIKALFRSLDPSAVADQIANTMRGAMVSGLSSGRKT